MVHMARTWIRTMLFPLARNRLLRKVFAYYFYRKWIVASETAFALRKDEKQSDDSYWFGMLRKYAHIVDRGLKRCDFTKGLGVRAYDQAKTALSHIQSQDTLEDPSFIRYGNMRNFKAVRSEHPCRVMRRRPAAMNSF